MRERLYTFAVSGVGDMFCHHSVSATTDHRAWRKLVDCIDMTATVKVTLIHVEKSQRRAAPADRRMPAAA